MSLDEHEDDDTAMWRAMRQRSVAKRAMNREQSAKVLTRADVAFSTHNLSSHLIVKHADKTVDFWPGTGKWTDREGPKGRGVFRLLKHLGVR